MKSENLRKAMLIQPGAVGDCILTLPLAAMLKNNFAVDSVSVVGKSFNTCYFVNRTPVDMIRDFDGIDLHRLFVSSEDFELEDDDILIRFFSGYDYIISFLGFDAGDFERNLIFTANCSNPAHVYCLPLKPPADFDGHVVDFHRQLIFKEFDAKVNACQTAADKSINFLKPLTSDISAGERIFENLKIDSAARKVIIHPGSGGINKCWHVDNFYMLAELLDEKNFQPIFLLGNVELERFSDSTISRLAAVCPLLCDLSITEALGVLAAADGFIGNDSGITHLASVMGRPTLAIFGSSNCKHFHPLGSNVLAVELSGEDFTSASSEKTAAIAKSLIKLIA